MKSIYSIAISSVLMAAPMLSQADSSYKDVYQFGTGSQGEVVNTASNSNSIGFAYDIFANNKFSSEKAEMAVLEQGTTTGFNNASSVPGYIGEY